jgi:hypothetical protein
MTETERKPFQNDHIQRRLFQKENVAKLEQVLETDLRRLRQLATTANVQKLGQRVSEASLPSLFAGVQRAVDRILDIDDITPPKLHGTRLFSRDHLGTLAELSGGLACFGGSLTAIAWPPAKTPDRGTVHRMLRRFSRRRLLVGTLLLIPGSLLFGKGALTEYLRLNDAGYVRSEQTIEFPLGRSQIPTELLIAHEYVHHVQNMTGFYPREGRRLIIAVEGHARGVERLWAKHRNPPALRPNSEHFQISFRLRELQRTYLAVCDHCGLPPKETLFGGHYVDRLRRKKPDVRYYGYALFRTYELALGDNIYRDMIHGTFALPMR